MKIRIYLGLVVGGGLLLMSAFAQTQVVPNSGTRVRAEQGTPGKALQPIPSRAPKKEEPGPPVVVVPPTLDYPLAALAWDAQSKKATLKDSELTTTFTFNLTNVSSAEVIINRVGTSCGCTAAELPEQPWKVAPGKGGPIQVTMNMQGKFGTVTKEVWVHTSLGTKTLEVTTVAPSPPPADISEQGKRQNNVRMSQANRQAVFRNDCATCHVEPGVGKKGAELYKASCGICHDSPHRASEVPDLTELPFPTDADFWRQWIKVGRPNSMMPAFANEHGGPLDQEQVNSLVEHLLKAMPSHRESLE